MREKCWFSPKPAAAESAAYSSYPSSPQITQGTKSFYQLLGCEAASSTRAGVALGPTLTSPGAPAGNRFPSVQLPPVTRQPER